MKSWSVGVSLVSVWAIVQAQFIQWDIENRHVHPTLSRRGESTFEEVIRNRRSSGGYFSSVQVGNPGQKITLQLDTGSSDIWVPWCNATICEDSSLRGGCMFGCFDPDESKSFQPVGPGLFKINYADHSYSKGDYFVDHFDMGGAFFKNLTMGLGLKTDIPFGLVGVGYAINEASTQTADVVYPNLPIAMYEAGFVNTIAYSLWLNDLGANTGSIVFGGIDTEKYVGELTQIDIIPDSEGNYADFAVALTSVVANSPSGSDTLTSSEFPIQAALDSGTTLSYLPQDLALQTWKEVGAIYNADYELAVLPCSHSQHRGNFSFGFAGSAGPRIDVAMDELVIDLTDGRTPRFESGAYESELVCVFGIQNETSDMAILGNSFLRSAYVVYDLVNNQIGLAATDFNSTKTNIVPFKSFGASIPSATTAPSQPADTGKPEATESNFTAADGLQNDDDNAAPSLNNHSLGLAVVFTALSCLLILGGGLFSTNLA